MTMFLRRFTGMAVGVFLATAAAAPANAQVTVSATCSPGIPGCASIRFFIGATGGIAIDQLFIELLTPGWTFTPGPTPPTGTYSAEDSFGPFGGFTTIGVGGTTIAMDFFGDNGFPFDVVDTDTGTLDLSASGSGDAADLSFTISGITDTGGTFETSVTPEPASLVLVATGLGAFAAAERKRKRRRVRHSAIADSDR
jgi:hypothetical protein